MNPKTSVNRNTGHDMLQLENGIIYLKARLAEEPITKGHEGGKKAANIIRKYNIPEQTFYR